MVNKCDADVALSDQSELRMRFPVPRMPMEAAVTLIPSRQYRGRPRRVCDMDQLHAALQEEDIQKYTRTLDGGR